MSSPVNAYGHLSSKNGDLYYERNGRENGKAMLFIHGLGGTTNTFQPVIHALQESDLIRFDFAGHGRSAVPSSPTSIESYVEDCEGEPLPQLQTWLVSFGLITGESRGRTL